MMPFRLGIFAGVAALCLWGLFSLLDSLQEPGLLRTEKAIVVKGCDPIESEQAREQCPALLCQKALLDAKLAPLDAKFEITVDQVYEGNERLLAGTAQNPNISTYFACDLVNMKVTQVQQLGPEAFDELSNPQ
jgi:hypothetical protein